MMWELVATLEVQDSVGNVVARGGSAAADFGSNRRLVIPKMLGRALAAAGQGAGLTLRNLGTSFGTEGATQTQATMAPHTHPMQASSSGSVGGAYVGGAYWLQNMDYSGPHGIEGCYPQTIGGGAPMTNIQPTSYLNVWIKL
jgi:microcystin-dependent protein